MRPSTIASVLAGIFLTAFGAFTGCVLREECGCTLIERPPVAVHVRDSAGPVTGAQVKVFRAKDGKEVTDPRFAAGDSARPGWYAVVGDDFGRSFPDGDLQMDLRVTAAKGSLKAEKTIRISTDGCGCHIDRIGAGADTLFLAP